MERISKTIPAWKYDEMHIEHWQSAETSLYNTREELEQAMPGNINWKLWDKLVDKTRKELKEMEEQTLKLKVKVGKPARFVYAYTTKGKFLGKYTSTQEAGEAFGIPSATIYQCCWRERPHYGKQIYFAYHELSEEELEEVKKMRVVNQTANGYAHGSVEKWVYDLDLNLLGHYKTPAEAAEAHGVERGTVNYYSWMRIPYKKKGLIFSSIPLEKEE